MFSTAIGFYLPAALISIIYFKLFMVFRERVRSRLDREVQMMKINESTKGQNTCDVHKFFSFFNPLITCIVGFGPG